MLLLLKAYVRWRCTNFAIFYNIHRETIYLPFLGQNNGFGEPVFRKIDEFEFLTTSFISLSFYFAEKIISYNYFYVKLMLDGAVVQL